MMKKSNATLKFILILLGFSALGGTIGYLLHGNEEVLIFSIHHLNNFLLKNNLLIQGIFYSAAAILILLLYFISKKQLKELKEDDEVLFDRIDNQLCFLIPFISVDLILSLSFFGISVNSMVIIRFDQQLGFLLILFLLNNAFCIFMTSKVINLTKILYPQKRGNPLEFNFQKEWLSSSDEGEKYIIYKAAYKAYQGLNLIFIISFVFTLFISLIINIGIFPFFLISFLWITQILIYSVYAFKLQRSKLENN